MLAKVELVMARCLATMADHPLFRQMWCVSLAFEGHQYHFMFNLANYQRVMQLVGKCAADPCQPLSWYQAACTTKRIREIVCSAQQAIAKTRVASDLAGDRVVASQNKFSQGKFHGRRW